MDGKKGPRKLLVASIGVATINYVLAGCEAFSTSSGNLVAPIAGSSSGGGAGMNGGGKGNAGTPPTVANLPFPEPMGGYPPVAGQAGQNAAGNGGSSGGGDAGGAPTQGGAAGEASGGETSGGGAGGAP